MDRLTLFPASSPQARRGAECRVYSRIVSGVGELFYGDTEGREVQLTRAGQPTSAAAKLAEGNAATLAGKGAESYVETSSVGAANGVASLGSDGKVPASQLPASSVSSRTLWTKTDTTSVNNTTTETSAIGSGTGSRVVAAGSMAVGTTFRVIVCGKVYSTASATTIKIAVKLGSVPLFDYALMPGNATKGFRIEAIATVRSTGASGSIVAAGAYLSQATFLGAAPLATATIDTTVDQTFDVTVAPAQANSGDGADVVLATIERLQ